MYVAFEVNSPIKKKKMLLLKLIHVQAGHVGRIGYE
jgi:hypothetical protein